jgi:hypothetical protein
VTNLTYTHGIIVINIIIIIIVTVYSRANFVIGPRAVKSAR